MGLAKRKHYRRRLYVSTLAIVLLGAIVAGWVVFLLFPADLGHGYHSALAAVQAIRKALFWRVALIYGVVSLLMLLSIAALHLFYSHLIAGPTYRIGREAGKIAQGNLACDFTLRRRDNLVDMKDVLNDLGCRYRARIAALGDSLAYVEVQSNAVSDLIRQGGDGARLGQAMEAITNTVEHAGRSLAEMKT